MRSIEEELDRKMKLFDCRKCKLRADGPPHPTNKGPACEIGFTQNPRTVEATRNLIANGGSVCFRHPMKFAEGRGW